MGLKKSQNKISNEELLDILKTDIITPEAISFTGSRIEREEDEVIGFIRFYNLETGKHHIQDKALYNLYKIFSKNPIKEKTFNKQLAHYIFKHQRDNRTFYRINQKISQLDDKAYELIKDTVKDAVKDPRIRQHFENFINKYNIKPGNPNNFIWVALDSLYSLYDEWAFSINRKIPLSLDKFKRFCKLYFEYKFTGRRKFYQPWFYVDKDITKILTKERISSIRAGSEKQHGNKAKKKEKKSKK